ncbi:hypothetical protein PENSPDRAFT_648457 [Peniophora sp. CONT]|nr:hypothetical protein PENSPDRAFT_648457 [Peniophora sp. CONT]
MNAFGPFTTATPSLSALLPSALRRSPATRSRKSPNKPRPTTMNGRRLSILVEEDEASASGSSRAPSPMPMRAPSPTPSIPSVGKRYSRYGKQNMLELPNEEADLTFERPRAAPRPPVQSSARQSVRLSAFDFDTAALSTSTTSKKERRLSRLPVGSESVASNTSSPTNSEFADPFASSRTLRHSSVRLSSYAFDLPVDIEDDSDAFSVASSSDYTTTSSSSFELPLTPSASDDEFSVPLSPLQEKAKMAPAVPIRPLVIVKQQSRFQAVQHDANEDDATWYTRELGSRFALASPTLKSSPGATKPLPVIPPPSPGQRTPSAQLDPTFLAARPPLPPTPPPARLSMRRSKRLTISIPPIRPPPSRPIPADVADMDVFDWAPTPSKSSGLLSPPRLPESPFSASSSRAIFAPEETEGELPRITLETPPLSPAFATSTIVAAALAGPVPAIVVSESVDALEPVQETNVLAQDAEYDETDAQSVNSFSPGLRSRWSSSTLSSEIEHGPLSPRMISSHFIRMVRSRRGSAPAPKPVVPRTPSPRASMDSLAFSDGSSDSGDSTSSSGLRRKPIPLALLSKTS